jgi:hypothetical protein
MSVDGEAKRGDRGSMPLAMLISIVAVGMSIVLVSIVTAQLRDTRSMVQRIGALNAAEAGLAMAAGYVQAAQNGSGVGVLNKLPCNVDGQSGAGNGNAFHITFEYYLADPHVQPDSWLAAQRLPCPVTTPPHFVRFTSSGSDGPGGTRRVLTATYRFKLALAGNTAGGRIHLIEVSGYPDECIAASSANPATGAVVQFHTCDSDDAAQNFAYDASLRLMLPSSQTPGTPNGMCLDGGSTPGVGGLVVTRPCIVPAPPRQRWSYNDWRNFEGTTDGVSLNGLCLNNAAGVLRLGGTADGKCRGNVDRVQSLSPDAAVGAGAAGPAADQLVNFEQFGRCLDVPQNYLDETGEAFWPYTMVYPCKQAPDPAGVSWNQRWKLPAVGTAGPIYTTHPTKGRYCVTPPSAQTDPLLITANPCPIGQRIPARMLWVVNGREDDLTKSYRVQDYLGRCLASSNLYIGSLANKAVVDTCSAARIQKWNASPDMYAPALEDVAEK